MGLTKVSNDLVAIETDETSDENSSDRPDRFSARIVCPFCAKRIPVAHSSAKLPNGRLSKPWWNTSNFDDHLKKHQYNFDVEKGDETSEVLSKYFLSIPHIPQEKLPTFNSNNFLGCILLSTELTTFLFFAGIYF